MNNPQALTLRQRQVVSQEIGRQFRKWKKALRREPTEDERRQIIAIGFSIARKKMPSIPKYATNPFVFSNSTKGPYPFAEKQKQYREYTVPMLLFSRRGAYEAAQAMKGLDPVAEAWYMDDVSTISEELRRRRVSVHTNPFRTERRMNGRAPRFLRTVANPRKDTSIQDAHSMHQALLKFLESRFPEFSEEEYDFDREAAIYWYANDYHTGQFSPLYQVLSISPFNPGPLHRSVEDEGEIATMMYDALVRRFAKPNPTGFPFSDPRKQSPVYRPVRRIGDKIQRIRVPLTEDMRKTAEAHERARKLAFGVHSNPTLRSQPDRPVVEAMKIFAERVKAVPRQMSVTEIGDVIREVSQQLGLTQEQNDRFFGMASEYYEYVQPWRPNPTLMTVMGANPKRRRRATSQESRVRRALANPKLRKRKITMSLERFRQFLQRKGDPRLMREFMKKIEGYRRWTHGSMPKRVTLEAVDVPGISGIWMTYGMGRQPESLYVMPPGSKRKGAWRHPWSKMPYLKGDPQSGMILTKLVSGNRITDFLHG